MRNGRGGQGLCSRVGGSGWGLGFFLNPQSLSQLGDVPWVGAVGDLPLLWRGRGDRGDRGQPSWHRLAPSRQDQDPPKASPAQQESGIPQGWVRLHGGATLGVTVAGSPLLGAGCGCCQRGWGTAGTPRGWQGRGVRGAEVSFNASSRSRRNHQPGRAIKPNFPWN